MKPKKYLEEALREQWSEISVNFVKNLIHFMPNSMQTIIRGKGDLTKY